MATTYQKVLFLHHPKSIPLKRFSKLKSCSNSLEFYRGAKNSSVKSPIFSPRCLMQPHIAPANDMDLKITIDRAVIISPLEETERRSCFLTSIEQRLNFKYHIVKFFPMNSDFPFDKIVTELQSAYRKILVHYDFLAGRLKWKTETHRLEIDCNSAGAGFVVAYSDLRLEELGDLVYPKMSYEQLALRKLKSLHHDDQPLIVVQVTSFKCGGFAIGFSVNHTTLDGTSLKIFLQNLASMLKDNRLVLPPYNDRQILSARSPPHIDFLHPEVIKLENMQGERINQIPFMKTFEKLERKVFNLSPNDITILKELAQMDGESNVHIANTFNLVTAHIWRCLALAKNSENDPKKLSTILYAMDCRSRLRPRLPTLYSGNAILHASCTTTCHQLEEGPISHIAKMISQAALKMNDEYIRSLIDYGELYNAVPYGDLLLTSWLKHGFDEIEYPWGRAKWTSPVLAKHGSNAIILVPDIKGTTYGGMNILMSLPNKEMEKFEGRFLKF